MVVVTHLAPSVVKVSVPYHQIDCKGSFVKTIFSSQAFQKQVVGGFGLWPVGGELWPRHSSAIPCLPHQLSSPLAQVVFFWPFFPSFLHLPFPHPTVFLYYAEHLNLVPPNVSYLGQGSASYVCCLLVHSL